ncbi:MAG: efflux transporter outer membrane subunit [Akkermansiaceae bacterium]|nr:efflux transporter outer membrane subunit [Akkermansiaceae bacterium]
MPNCQLLCRLVSCSVLLVVVSACGPVGPDHEVPAIEVPASFSRGGVSWKRQVPGSQPRPQRWWRLYRDATLTGVVERALAKNQDLASAAARLRQAREMSNQARSLYFPDIHLGAAAERSKIRYRGSGGGAIQSNNFSIPVDFRYELDIWGKVGRQVESATASEAAAAESLSALQLSVAGEVAQTYWALRAVDANRAVLTRTLEIRRKALDLLTKRHDVGNISGLDLSRAETEVATAEAERIRLDQDRVVLVNALAVLGGAIASGSAIADNPELPKPPAVPVAVPSEVLRQRPDIRAAERRVAAANADIGVATAAFYPSFSINASSGLDATRLGDLFQASSLVWSIGSSALMPVTSQKYLKAQRNAAVAAHAAASADYRQAVLESVREVENALQGAAILERRQVAQDRALASAQKTLELAAKQFEAGLVSFLDVVDAERTRLDNEQAANAVRAQRLALSVSLIKALGGEW